MERAGDHGVAVRAEFREPVQLEDPPCSVLIDVFVDAELDEITVFLLQESD